MPAGRPTEFKPEYVEQVKKLCLLGATDDEIADFFGVTRVEIEFYQFSLALIRQDRNGVVASRKRKRGEQRKLGASVPSKKIVNSMRARVWAALKGRSDGALFSRLRYGVEELRGHLQGLFREGMDWENYGKWHVDHVRPCASFDLTDPAQFDECWALGNLQPLWALENIKKGSTYGAA